jgi:hypothetical protein
LANHIPSQMGAAARRSSVAVWLTTIMAQPRRVVVAGSCKPPVTNLEQSW